MGAAASIEGAAPAPAPLVVQEAPAPMKNEDDDWSWRRLELGRFTVRGVDVVGCGAHCVVRKDEAGTVAVKYYGGADAAERLAREVRRLKQLDENRIIAYGDCLLASPLYEDALADHVCGLCSRAAPPGAVARIVRDIAQALAHAHSLGIVHGDVKPANVARKHRNEPWVLLDWDDALDVGTSTKLCFFTELYAAPECLLMDELAITPSIDVWGLGATALEALTAGAHPLSSELDVRGAGFASWLGRASHEAVDAFWASFGAGPVLDFVRTLCALNASDRPTASAAAATALELTASLPEGDVDAPEEAPAPTRRRRAFSFFRDEFLPERLAAGVERKRAVRELTKEFAALKRTDAEAVAVYASRASAANGELSPVVVSVR